MVRIEYDNEISLDLAEGELENSILEISIKNEIPHMRVCGGQARCSTCRVMVLENPENVTPPNDIEASLIRDKGFEKNIRLACQAKLTGPVKLRRLVFDRADAEVALAEKNFTSGRETRLAVLFSDIRGFTPFSENVLPYDVVHVLNRYFRRMGEAVIRHGGYIDKYMGDGLMALFGAGVGVGAGEEDEALACRRAVAAALEMETSLEELNRLLEEQFNHRFRIGVGVHFGEVILGEMGHPASMQYTAIGDAVNLASRIEQATKKAGVSLLVSESVYRRVATNIRVGKKFDAALKGKTGRFKLYEIKGMDPDLNRQGFKETVEFIRLFLHFYVTRDLAPAFLRLAFHDAVSGCNASIRFEEEYTRDCNAGLEDAIGVLRDAKVELGKQIPGIPFADLIALAGAVAVEKCGGPFIEVELGRSDADGPLPERAPGADMRFEELRRIFAAIGLGIRDMVALSGAHTLGRTEGIAFTEDLFDFTNSYFRRLLLIEAGLDEGAELSMLPSDTLLVRLSETRPIIEEYALDQERFFKDFTVAYRRMTRVQ